MYWPALELLTATTVTVQQTALDQVLASFPAILGDGPKDELRRIVEQGSVNVMANVKEGVRLILEAELAGR